MPDFSMFFEKYSTHISWQFFIELSKFSLTKNSSCVDDKKIRLILGIANKRVNKLCCINRICVSTYSDKKAHFSSMQFVAGRYQKSGNVVRM
jgi:hypothetical protein